MHKPNLFIIGVHKAATTSLYNYFKFHKDIFVTAKKELHHYSPLIYSQSVSPEANYLKHYDKSDGNTYRLDASPSYLYGKASIATELTELSTESKCIVILRDPCKRFYSFYKQAKYMDEIPSDESFTTFIEKSITAFDTFEEDKEVTRNYYNRSLREGCYSLYLEDWLSIYGRDLKIIYFEDLIKSSYETMTEIVEWLGIDNPYQGYSFNKENSSRQAKNVTLQNFSRKIFFRFESFFRNSPLLKKILTFVYRQMNTKQFEDENTTANQKLIYEFYQSYNVKLCMLLSKYDRKLPEWKL